jgi:hypothetical protein
MTLSQFRSLSIGDIVIAGELGRLTVTNVFFRSLDGEQTSFIALNGLGEVDESFAGLLAIVGVGVPETY